MYKSVEQEVEEMDERDSLPRVGSVLKILIGKVCQKCNVPSVIVNSRLVQEFKTKIWRLNQALAKAKTKGGNGLRKLFSQWTYGKYSTWSFKIYYNELESVRLQNETVNWRDRKESLKMIKEKQWTLKIKKNAANKKVMAANNKRSLRTKRKRCKEKNWLPQIRKWTP